MARPGFRVRCPNCNAGFRVPAAEAGRTVLCGCGRQFPAADPAGLAARASVAVNLLVAFLVFGVVAGGLGYWGNQGRAKRRHVSPWVYAVPCFVLGGVGGATATASAYGWLPGRRPVR